MENMSCYLDNVNLDNKMGLSAIPRHIFLSDNTSLMV